MSKYLGKSPKRISHFSRRFVSTVRGSLSRITYLIVYTISPYEQSPIFDKEISLASPKGEVTAAELPLIERLAERADKRLHRLEQKAVAMLSVIGVVAPIFVATTVFMLREVTASDEVRLLLVVLAILVLVFIGLSFIAALRALSVRGWQELYLSTVIDDETDRIRKYDANFYGRGMLYVTASREALNDHVTNFVRASHLFIAIAISLVLMMGIVLIPLIES